jgi:small-conductance mechanosensitive channel
MNPALIEEILRDTLGALTFIGFSVAIFFAARRFLGQKGKTPSRSASIFAGFLLVFLLGLLAVRSAVEAYLIRLSAPLSRLTADQSNWPQLAVVGYFRLLIIGVATVLIIQAIGRIYWYLDTRLHRWNAGREGLVAHSVVFLTLLLRLARFLSVVMLFFGVAPLILNSFPRTKILVDQTEGFLEKPAKDLGIAVLQYLPNLGYLIVILVVGFYSLKAIRYLFTSVETGSLQIKGFLPEWANPTYRLIRTLFLLFLLMVAFPYLPGSKSQFFQGFSVFLGALITFGSTATIGNIVSGTVLTYTRAFRIGDMVTIGDKTGVVIEKNLLVTRLLTPKQEEVSIPNGNVLSTSVLNYSARAKQGLVLSVTAGIGYDVDWRKVHHLMLEGARATGHIAADPAPHVFQEALGDYAVNYELRAYTNHPVEMFYTLSELRANILDEFNRAGVEIMTPSIFAHRDASHLAVPPEQFTQRADPSGIAIKVQADGRVSTSA